LGIACRLYKLLPLAGNDIARFDDKQHMTFLGGVCKISVGDEFPQQFTNRRESAPDPLIQADHV
jgi:hypothetical protein